MIVVTRYRVEPGTEDAFQADVATAMVALTERTGFLDADLGQNADDPTLWTLTLRWRDVGSYRRALSAYDVKVSAVPLLSRALDEPSAYVVVGRWRAGDPGGGSLDAS